LPGRGLEQAIRALAGAPQVRLRLIGPGSENYRGALLQVAEEAGVADRTEFVAPVAPAAVLEAIADADFGVMLIEPVCRSYELTLPNKLFEYAGAGLPILASNLPVIASVVREQQLGEVVPPDSPELIGRAMVRLADPAHNRQLREHVASFASRSTWESEQQILERVYRDLQPAADGPAESPADAARSQEQERIRRAYDRYAHDPRKQQDWAADNPGNDAIRSELVQRVFTLAGPALQDARRVLDIGCGTGWWLATLTGDDRVSAELHGLELLPERASAAADRVPRAEIATGDARALPYDDQSFDVVTLFTVLSSLAGADDAERALREARRVLANSGMLLIWEPRLPNPLNRSTRLITRGLIGSALSGMELDVRTLTVLPPVARRLGSRTARLYPILAALPPLRTHRLTCARKSSDGGMELHPEATPGLD
jgi:ubiquinone/menaquinone biosynthesis C-methylase UbiE